MEATADLYTSPTTVSKGDTFNQCRSVLTIRDSRYKTSTPLLFPPAQRDDKDAARPRRCSRLFLICLQLAPDQRRRIRLPNHRSDLKHSERPNKTDLKAALRGQPEVQLHMSCWHGL